MTIFFKSRTEARSFKSKNGNVVDHGKDSATGRRWGFQIKKGE